MAAPHEITGHLQIRANESGRRYSASWWDAKGGGGYDRFWAGARPGQRLAHGARRCDLARRGRPLPAGPPDAEDGRSATRGAARGRAGGGSGRAGAQLGAVDDDIPTFGDAVDAWLDYLQVEKRRKKSTVQDARNVVAANLIPRFGRDTPLYAIDRREVIVRRNGRQFAELREERRDTFTTDDVDAYRRELLASDLSPRTAQKVLVLLHGVFKLAKRRKLIASNPSEDAERITLEDPGIFNILEPVEFEAVYRAVVGGKTIGPRGSDAATRSTI